MPSIDWNLARDTYQGVVPPQTSGSVLDVGGPPVMAAAPVQVAPPPVTAAPAPVEAAPAPTPVAEPVAAAPTETPSVPAKPPTFDQSISDYKQSAQQQANAVRQGAEIDAKAIENQGEVYQAQADEIAAQQAAYKKEQEEYAKTRAETLEEFKQLNRQAENMRAVDSRTTSQRVMGTIGIALGSVADGLARMGGNNATNYAGEVQGQIQNQIDRDLARQKEAIDDKKKSAANRLTELGLARQFFGDTQDAMQFATAQISLKYAAQLKAVASKTSNEAAKNAAEQAALELESKSDLNIAQLVERRDEQKMKLRFARPAGGTGTGTGGQFNAQELLRKLDAGEPMSKQELDYALKLDSARDRDTANENRKNNSGKDSAKGTIIPGYEPVDETAQSLAPGDVHKAREIASGVEGIRSAGNRLASLYAEIEQAEAAGNAKLANQLRSRYYTAGGQFLVQKSLAGGQGVINSADAERDAQEGAVPPPPGAPASIGAKFTQLYKGVSPSADGIRALTSDITSDGVSKLKIYNMKPAASKNQNPDGNFKPVYKPAEMPDTPKTGKVMMELPNGNVVWIPEQNVAQAESLGAKRR